MLTLNYEEEKGNGRVYEACGDGGGGSGVCYGGGDVG